MLCLFNKTEPVQRHSQFTGFVFPLSKLSVSAEWAYKWITKLKPNQQWHAHNVSHIFDKRRSWYSAGCVCNFSQSEQRKWIESIWKGSHCFLQKSYDWHAKWPFDKKKKKDKTQSAEQLSDSSWWRLLVFSRWMSCYASVASCFGLGADCSCLYWTMTVCDICIFAHKLIYASWLSVKLFIWDSRC